MKEEFGNLLTMSCDALCVTTNGFVKKNGECVMGKGIAKTIQSKYPNIPYTLGQAISLNGNVVHHLYDKPQNIISFPVKPVSKKCTSPDDYVSHMRFNIGDTIPGWACKADIEIIKQSAKKLVSLANKHPEWKRILLPRPGCGAGELNWNNVKQVLSEILDDRFVCVTFPQK